MHKKQMIIRDIRKRLTAGLLTGIIAAIGVNPVFADTFSEDGVANTLVTAELTSSYSVIVPASIALSDPDKDGTYTATYTIGAKGNISILKKVSCKPTGSTFTLTNENSVSVTGSVNQTVNEWVKKDAAANQKMISDVETGGTYDGYSIVTGDLSADIVQAGSYTGNLEFTFMLDDK